VSIKPTAEERRRRAQFKPSHKPLPKDMRSERCVRICPTCNGTCWLWSGCGHFGIQEGYAKRCSVACPHCGGTGYFDQADA
jgi:hypothetical protein